MRFRRCVKRGASLFRMHLLGLTLVVMFTAAAVYAGGTGGSPAPSSSPLSADKMVLSVRPEYDSKDVLVTYDFMLVNKSERAFSGKFRFIVPKGSRISQGCEITKEGEHVCQLFKLEDKGDRTEVTWDSQRAVGPGEVYNAYMEFYYNPIKGGPDKSIDYEFVPSYPIDSLQLIVTQPARSSGFVLTPSPASMSQTPDGLNLYTYNFSNVKGNVPIRLGITYTKRDSRSSIESKGNEQEAAPAQASAGAASDNTNATGGQRNWGLIGLVAVFVGILGFFLYYAATAGRVSGGTDSGGSGRNPDRGRGLGRSVDERKRARELLFQGKISEETYKQIISDLKKEGK